MNNISFFVLFCCIVSCSGNQGQKQRQATEQHKRLNATLVEFYMTPKDTIRFDSIYWTELVINNIYGYNYRSTYLLILV